MGRFICAPYKERFVMKKLLYSLIVGLCLVHGSSEQAGIIVEIYDNLVNFGIDAATTYTLGDIEADFDYLLQTGTVLAADQVDTLDKVVNLEVPLSTLLKTILALELGYSL